MVKKKDTSSNGVRQAQADIKAIRKRTKKLLKNAQLDVREYRRQLATLKKQQIVSKRINAAKHQPTRYMLRKLKQFKPVALGKELAIPISKLSPHRARQYTEKGIAERVGKFLTIPKTAAKQKADIFKGRIRTTEKLKRGELEVIKFGTRLEDMHAVLDWLQENEAMLNELKGPMGQFGFQISGNNSRRGLINVQDLIQYLMKYDGSDQALQDNRGNLYNGDSHEIVKEFIIFRFRPAKGSGNQVDLEPYYGVRRLSKKRMKERREGNKFEHLKRKKAAERQARKRMAESKEDYERRLQKQREYDKRKANERREQRMYKKLMGD